MEKYFLQNGAGHQGPFNFETLKTKHITKQTPIWYDGLTDWKNAGEIEELKGLFLISTPPPFEDRGRDQPPVYRATPYLERKEKRSKSKRSFFIVIGFLVVLGAIIIAVNNGSSSNSTGSYQQEVMTVEQTELSQPATFLSADGNYNKNFWGDKYKVHGVIKNAATIAAYKDAVVRITYYSKTGTVLASKEYTIYEKLQPRSTTRFELKIENFKNVNSVGWEVLSAVPN